MFKLLDSTQYICCLDSTQYKFMLLQHNLASTEYT